jgi:glycosyltransferase involved in cell wall biosynthesis
LIVDGLVSTIIPVYNRAAMVREAVESVLNQSYRPIEIIVVDDGSTDDTPGVVDRLARAWPDVIRVIHKANEGPGLAREAGRNVARGEFIQYLDSDDLLLPPKFGTQVALLHANADCGIAYGVTRLVDEKGALLRAESKWTGQKLEYLFPGLLIDRWWHTSTPLYRRSVSDAAGPWPARRPEDWDLEARMGANRVRLAYDPSPVSCHRHHESPNRVTLGSRTSYLLDEAWFLPRLFDCAVRAGVGMGAPEMAHFAKWAFMVARELGSMNESQDAWNLLALAKRSAPSPRLLVTVTGILAKACGWKVAAAVCGVGIRMRGALRETQRP